MNRHFSIMTDHNDRAICGAGYGPTEEHAKEAAWDDHCGRVGRDDVGGHFHPCTVRLYCAFRALGDDFFWNLPGENGLATLDHEGLTADDLRRMAEQTVEDA